MENGIPGPTYKARGFFCGLNGQTPKKAMRRREETKTEKMTWMMLRIKGRGFKAPAAPRL